MCIKRPIIAGGGSLKLKPSHARISRSLIFFFPQRRFEDFWQWQPRRRKKMVFMFITTVLLPPATTAAFNDNDEEKGDEGEGFKKRPWTQDEDAKLLECVNENGPRNWEKVVRSTGLDRSGKSCRFRWMNYLRPDLRQGPFTAEEIATIESLHARFGNKWARIAKELPGRTDNEIKNFHNTRNKRQQRERDASHPPSPMANVERASPLPSPTTGIVDWNRHPNPLPPVGNFQYSVPPRQPRCTSAPPMPVGEQPGGSSVFPWAARQCNSVWPDPCLPYQNAQPPPLIRQHSQEAARLCDSVWQYDSVRPHSSSPFESPQPWYFPEQHPNYGDHENLALVAGTQMSAEHETSYVWGDLQEGHGHVDSDDTNWHQTLEIEDGDVECQGKHSSVGGSNKARRA